MEDLRGYRFDGSVTISADGLFRILAEHIEPEAAAKLVVSLQQQQAPAAPAERPPLAVTEQGPVEVERCFVPRSGDGTAVRLAKVDDSYAYFVRLDGRGRWAMPISDFEGPKFRDHWRAATIDEVVGAAGVFAGD